MATLDDLPHAFNPAGGHVAPPTATARLNRLREALATQPTSRQTFQRLSTTLAWNAERLVPLLVGVRADDTDVEQARQRLLAWDKRVSADSSAATLYVLWERSLFRALAAARLDSTLADEYLGRAPNVLVAALVQPSRVWFDGDPRTARDGLLVTALARAVEELRTTVGVNDQAWGRLHAVTFAHPLGVTAMARQQFNVGPFGLPGYAGTVMSTYGSGFAVDGGASFREIVDLADWDRSLATNAPGQSGSPGNSHFADLAGWGPRVLSLVQRARGCGECRDGVGLVPLVARRPGGPSPQTPTPVTVVAAEGEA
jgi:penicillin amidase